MIIIHTFYCHNDSTKKFLLTRIYFHLNALHSSTPGVPPSTPGVPQRQLSTGSTLQTQQTISNPSHPQKFVIVKPGINIQQQQVKPNIVVMNPPGSNTQVNILK